MVFLGEVEISQVLEKTADNRKLLLGVSEDALALIDLREAVDGVLHHQSRVVAIVVLTIEGRGDT